MRYFLEQSEYTSLSEVKKVAIKLAKERNDEVYFTCLSANFKQTWYTALPTGLIKCDGKNLSFNN